MTKDEFVKRAEEKHGQKYDYSNIENFKKTNREIKVRITCPIHGEFEQRLFSHLSGAGCPLCARIERGKKMKGRGLIYTKEKCREIALKCKSRYDFEKKSQRAYYNALVNGWLDEYVWLSKPEKYEPTWDLRNNSIYVYAFNDACYIGRTNDPKRRDRTHRRDESSSVYQYAKKLDIDIPTPVILEENLSLGDSREREEYWCNYYKNKGFLLLNKGKVGRFSGSIGSYLLHNNYDQILSIAKLYKQKSEFMKNHASKYNAVRRMGKLEQLHEDCGWPDHASKKKVYVYTKDGKLLFCCNSLKDAEKKTNVDFRLISMNCRRITKSAKGFVFKYENKQILENGLCFHRGDYLRWHQVHEQIGKITGIDTFSNTIELTDKDGICLANIEDFEPIPIEPAVLEAFGFTLEYIVDMCFAKLKFDDGTGVYLSKKGWDWVFSNNEPFEIPQCIYTICCPVVNIHDIQHAMRVAGITKELEYKEK